MAGAGAPLRAPIPATIWARSVWAAETLFSLVRASSTAWVPITRSNFSPASMRFCTPPAVSLTTVTVSPVRAAVIGGQGAHRHGHARAGEDFQVFGVGGQACGQQEKQGRNEQNEAS